MSAVIIAYFIRAGLRGEEQIKVGSWRCWQHNGWSRQRWIWSPCPGLSSERWDGGQHGSPRWWNTQVNRFGKSGDSFPQPEYDTKKTCPNSVQISCNLHQCWVYASSHILQWFIVVTVVLQKKRPYKMAKQAIKTQVSLIWEVLQFLLSCPTETCFACTCTQARGVHRAWDRDVRATYHTSCLTAARGC